MAASLSLLGWNGSKTSFSLSSHYGFSGKIEHVVQINATLIDDEWCTLFKNFGFYFGVSIDGNALFNQNRVKRNGSSSFDAIIAGVQALRRNEISFTAIAVVGGQAIDAPEELYSFFVVWLSQFWREFFRCSQYPQTAICNRRRKHTSVLGASIREMESNSYHSGERVSTCLLLTESVVK